jgi:FixJ family two-component response regulator
MDDKKNKLSAIFSVGLFNNRNNHKNSKDTALKKSGKKTRYYLGNHYPGIFLTEQEAKCMFYCMQKFTSKKTGFFMDINFRTVEYYRDNIRCKIGADSKKEMIEKIKNTNFMSYIDHLKNICKK